MEEQVQSEEIQVLDARPVPEPREGGTIELWGREVGPLALAASAGAVAGVAAVAVARAARPPQRKVPRRGLFRRRERIVAGRSFLVDVHVLGR
jgi:hypothetical protein